MYGDNRDLHSFPTRRSSDLGIAPCGCPKSVSVEESGLVVDVAAKKVVLRGLEVNPGDPVVRSEEHTSELQSLRHLVCRLLLEKKKKIKAGSVIVANSPIGGR